MNALIDQLTALRLHGMAACAHDLLSARKPPSLTTAIKQLIDAETVERRVRSIQYQMRIAKFPHHKDFATFDYGAAAVTKAQIEPFCTGQFTEEAHNLILVGGTGTGKTHIAIALGTTLINNGKKARFFNAVDLINALPLVHVNMHCRAADQGTGRRQRREDHPAIVSPGLRHHRRVGLYPVPEIRRRIAVPPDQQAL